MCRYSSVFTALCPALSASWKASQQCHHLVHQGYLNQDVHVDHAQQQRVVIKVYDQPHLSPRKRKMATREAITLKYLTAQGCVFCTDINIDMWRYVTICIISWIDR
jgi:hypothetical protein